jgi:hypothetical protein
MHPADPVRIHMTSGQGILRRPILRRKTRGQGTPPTHVMTTDNWSRHSAETCDDILHMVKHSADPCRDTCAYRMQRHMVKAFRRPIHMSKTSGQGTPPTHAKTHCTWSNITPTHAKTHAKRSIGIPPTQAKTQDAWSGPPWGPMTSMESLEAAWWPIVIGGHSAHRPNIDSQCAVLGIW